MPRRALFDQLESTSSVRRRHPPQARYKLSDLASTLLLRDQATFVVRTLSRRGMAAEMRVQPAGGFDARVRAAARPAGRGPRPRRRRQSRRRETRRTTSSASSSSTWRPWRRVRSIASSTTSGGSIRQACPDTVKPGRWPGAAQRCATERQQTLRFSLVPGVLHIARGRGLLAGRPSSLATTCSDMSMPADTPAAVDHLAIVDEAPVSCTSLASARDCAARRSSRVRGRLETVEQPGLGEDHGAVADRQHLFGVRRGALDPAHGGGHSEITLPADPPGTTTMSGRGALASVYRGCTSTKPWLITGAEVGATVRR